MITLAPPPTSVYVFTAEQINQIKFDEPDSDETITWNDVSEGPSSFSLRRSSSAKKNGAEVQAEPVTPAMRSVTIVKLIEKMTNGYTGKRRKGKEKRERKKRKKEKRKKAQRAKRKRARKMEERELIFCSETQDFWDTILYTIETFTNASCFLDLLAKRYPLQFFHFFFCFLSSFLFPMSFQMRELDNECFFLVLFYFFFCRFNDFFFCLFCDWLVLIEKIRRCERCS